MMHDRFGQWCRVGALSLFALGCASKRPAAAASTAQCPPGQTFDGQFCQVDQTVATAEQPVEDQESQQPLANPPGAASPDEVAPVASSDPSAAELGSSRPQLEGSSEPAVPASNEPTTSLVFVAPPAAAPVDYAMAAQAAPVMQYFAASHLPAGSRPFGSPFAGQFQEGQGLIKKLQLTAGKCYTIVGMGLPPLTEVDIKLVDPKDGRIVLQDETTGPQAVLGSRDQCYLAEQGGAFSVVLIATQGQGIAAAQVFQK